MSSIADLAVIGSGSLARAVCCSLAVAASFPLRVSICARDQVKAAEAVYLAAARARLSGTAARFEARPLGAGDAELIVVCASEQSPWERETAPSAWTSLMAEAGFGITLPLQASVAMAVATARPGATIVNACYPDAVNPLLQACGIPILCGIGNVAILTASLAAALDVAPERLKVLAHHAHLHRPSDPDDEARAWLDGEPVTGVTKALAAQRSATRSQLNVVTGHSAALLLLGMLGGQAGSASLPGPLGLSGGYPVRLMGFGKLELDLPPGVGEAEAVDFNRRAAESEGVVVSAGAVTFGEKARRALEPHAPALAGGFAPSDLPEVMRQFRALRARLRQEGARR
jgi:hypothetical protein